MVNGIVAAPAGYGFEALEPGGDGFDAVVADKGTAVVGDPIGWAYYLDIEPHRTAIQQTTKGFLLSVKTDPDDDGSWESHFYPFD